MIVRSVLTTPNVSLSRIRRDNIDCNDHRNETQRSVIPLSINVYPLHTSDSKIRGRVGNTAIEKVRLLISSTGDTLWLDA
ncbi:hypothetical protein TNCV_899691 [Trichonephila clavipes]|nr:hypothetical protein TNCV_899691 [Trichonephila clavipes]